MMEVFMILFILVFLLGVDDVNGFMVDVGSLSYGVRHSHIDAYSRQQNNKWKKNVERSKFFFYPDKTMGSNVRMLKSVRAVTKVSFSLNLVSKDQEGSIFRSQKRCGSRFGCSLGTRSTRSTRRRSVNSDLHQDQQKKDVKEITNVNSNYDNSIGESANIPWQLFLKYHAKRQPSGNTDESSIFSSLSSWRGTWTTYNYMGDVETETLASVNYEMIGQSEEMLEVRQSHTIATSSIQSDCVTCFDSMESRTLPVATYSSAADLAAKRVRLGACGMVTGPTLLRSGAMATELCLSYKDCRVRVTFQYAPVWEQKQQNTQNPTALPDGLKLFRVIVAREAMRPDPPTRQSEQAELLAQRQLLPTDNDSDVVLFHRPVSPFMWHKRWTGTSWTWGEQHGDRGWKIDELDDTNDAWHGTAPPELWNLRLSSICIQVPRVMLIALPNNDDGKDDLASTSTDLLRVAWLPVDGTLLRLEAGVMPLKPIHDEQLNMIVGMEQPKLISYRCDVLSKVGDLDGTPSFFTE